MTTNRLTKGNNTTATTSVGSETDKTISNITTSINRRDFIRFTATAATIPAVASCASSSHKISLNSKLPISPFNAKSTAEQVTEGLNLTGKVVVITGCNSGIGYETMRVLALRGAHVIGTGRTLEKAEKACASVTGKTTPMVLELSNLASVVKCADEIKKLQLPVDILILNAGIGSYTKFKLINGIESIFHINYLGHFLFANHMLPAVQQANHGRIIHVGSQMAYTSAPKQGIDFDNLHGEKEFDSVSAYSRSKLANALLSLKLSKQLDPAKTTSNVIHPGFVQTNIGRSAPAFVRIAFDFFGGAIAKSPAQGAATQTYVATAPTLTGISGAYFEDCNPVNIDGPNHLFDQAMADKLWIVSTELCKGYL